jgi:DNA polymerase delta subunit 3
MANDFRTHLASELISDQKTVSYRTLARALKVHVNAAKCMLYEFNAEQNKRKPGSVYATYLVSGTKKHEQESRDTTMTNGKHDTDAPPPSSPPVPSSSMPGPSQQESAVSVQEAFKVRTVTLVREEHLEGS